MAISTINHFDMSVFKEFAAQVYNNVCWAGRQVQTFFCETLGSKVAEVWAKVRPGLEQAYAQGSKLAEEGFAKLQATPYGVNGALGVAGISLLALTSDAKGVKKAVAKTVSVSMILVSAVRLYKEYQTRTGL